MHVPIKPPLSSLSRLLACRSNIRVSTCLSSFTYSISSSITCGTAPWSNAATWASTKGPGLWSPARPAQREAPRALRILVLYFTYQVMVSPSSDRVSLPDRCMIMKSPLSMALPSRVAWRGVAWLARRCVSKITAKKTPMDVEMRPVYMMTVMLNFALPITGQGVDSKVMPWLRTVQYVLG